MLLAGLDARLWAFIPLSTLFAVMGTVLLLTLPMAVTAPEAALPAFLVGSATGLWLAIRAWPVTLPLALVLWMTANWLLRSSGLEERQRATIAGGVAGLGGAMSFALWAGWRGVEGTPVILAVLIPAVVAGAVLAAFVVYRRTAA